MCISGNTDKPWQLGWGCCFVFLFFWFFYVTTHLFLGMALQKENKLFHNKTGKSLQVILMPRQFWETAQVCGSPPGSLSRVAQR